MASWHGSNVVHCETKFLWESQEVEAVDFLYLTLMKPTVQKKRKTDLFVAFGADPGAIARFAPNPSSRSPDGFSSMETHSRWVWKQEPRFEGSSVNYKGKLSETKTKQMLAYYANSPPQDCSLKAQHDKHYCH
jgi:hypothetical protein